MNDCDREQQVVVRQMMGMDLDGLDQFALWFWDTYDVVREHKVTECELDGDDEL